MIFFSFPFNCLIYNNLSHFYIKLMLILEIKLGFSGLLFIHLRCQTITK